ncbi:MAG: RagB/SusD family nutrient uptake outer membrane protein, partial [Tannerella sp.]|nr:RagB/SusD family nutrient uptake outer membrane protein [Tannerella sp.]
MKINKAIRTLWLAVPAVLWTVSSCSVMDTQPFESYDEATVWGSRNTADAFVNGTISNVMNGYINGNQTSWEERTNNTVHNNGTGGFVRDEMDRFSTDGGFGDFGNIRRCNLIIEKAAEYSGQGLLESDAKELIAKGKFLRAALYYRQARTMGRFVWVDRVLSPADTTANGLALPTTQSTTESYTYLIKDLQEAIPDLPETAASGDISRNAGYAFLSEVALQGAAYEPDQAKKKEWLRLAISAADNIKNSALASDYGNIFIEDDRYSSELIFCVYRDKANTTAEGIAPLMNVVPLTATDRMSASGSGPNFKTNGGAPFFGWLWWAPTQNLIDEYEVIDEATGEAVRWDESSQFKNNVTISDAVPEWTTEGEVGEVIYSGTVNGDFSVSDLMYKNRDARFQASIV